MMGGRQAISVTNFRLPPPRLTNRLQLKNPQSSAQRPPSPDKKAFDEKMVRDNPYMNDMYEIEQINSRVEQVL